VHKVAHSEDRDGLDRQSCTLVKAFEQAHPEDAQVFDSSVAQRAMPDGTGFRTVEQKQ
jgi:hypothetical protein